MNKQAIAVLLFLILIGISAIVINGSNGKIANETSPIISHPENNVSIIYYSNQYLLSHSHIVNNTTYNSLIMHMKKQNILYNSSIKISNAVATIPYGLDAPNYNITFIYPLNLYNYLLPKHGVIIYQQQITFTESGTHYILNQTSPVFPGKTFYGYGNSNVADYYERDTLLSEYAVIISGTNFLNSITTLPNYISYSPAQFIYNANQYQHNSTYWVTPTYNISAYYSNSAAPIPAYPITFTNNVPFNITIAGTTYTDQTSLTVSEPNGTYYYTVTYNGSTYYSTVVVSGQNVQVNIKSIPIIINTMAYLYLYLAISFIGVMALLRLSQGFISIYGMLSVMIVYLGYRLQIEYFNTTIIAIIITMLCAFISYKVVLEE